MKVHVRVKHIEDKMQEYVENNSEEIYIDYRDELSSKQIDEILAGKADEVRGEIEEDYQSAESTGDYECYWKEMCKELGCTMDDVQDWLENGDGFYPWPTITDNGWERLIRNTRVCITATVWDAEWNFNNWAYGEPVFYGDTDTGKGLKTVLKLLGINPLDFLNMRKGGSATSGEGELKGWFPNLPDRIPKVNTEDLFNNMCALYDGVLNFCLGDIENIAEVLSGDSANITFLKGTNIVMYNFGNGGGITEVKLTGDVTIPRKMIEFRNDSSNKWGIQECYGFVHSYWQEGAMKNG